MSQSPEKLSRCAGMFYSQHSSKSTREATVFLQGFCGFRGSGSRGASILSGKCLPPQRPLADERDHAGGYSEGGGVGGGESLQADDHVVASFGDDLAHILFLGREEKSKGVGLGNFVIPQTQR